MCGWHYLPVQDLLRPAACRGRAYHYAEDSARAVVQEQMASTRGQPGLGEMCAVLLHTLTAAGLRLGCWGPLQADGLHPPMPLVPLQVCARGGCWR